MSALAAFSNSGSHLHPHPHSRLWSESHTPQQHLQQHMEQVPEQQQLHLDAGTGRAAGLLHNLGHGLRAAAVHLPTRTHQHIPAELSRRNSADAPGTLQASRGVAAEGAGAFGGSHSWGASAPHPAGSGSSGSNLLHQGLLRRQQQQDGSSSISAVAAAASIATAAAGAGAAPAAPPTGGGVAVRGISRAHSGSSRAGAGGGEGGSGGARANGCLAAAATAAGFGSVVEVDGLKQPLLSSCDQDDDSNEEELSD